MRNQFKGRLNTKNTIPFRTGDFRDRRPSDHQADQGRNDSAGDTFDDLKTFMESSNLGEELFHLDDLEYVYKPKKNEFEAPKHIIPNVNQNVSVLLEEPKDEHFWYQK